MATKAKSTTAARRSKAAATPQVDISNSTWIVRSNVAQVTALWDTTPHLIHDVNGTCFRVTPSGKGLVVRDRVWLDGAFAEEYARQLADPADRVHLFCERCCVTRRTSVAQVKATKKVERSIVLAELVEGVKRHAVENYNEAGWDVVVEAMDDAEIGRLVGQARTIDGAIKKVKVVVSEINSRRAEIINA